MITKSFKVNEEENSRLENLVTESGMTISDYTRRALFDSEKKVQVVYKAKETYMAVNRLRETIDALEVKHKNIDFDILREGMLEICRTLNV